MKTKAKLIASKRMRISTIIFVLIAIILFATYTFYDAFTLIKESTSVDWEQNGTGEKK